MEADKEVMSWRRELDMLDKKKPTSNPLVGKVNREVMALLVVCQN